MRLLRLLCCLCTCVSVSHRSEFLNHLIHIYEDWRDQYAIGGHRNALFFFFNLNHQLQHGGRTSVGSNFRIPQCRMVIDLAKIRNLC